MKTNIISFCCLTITRAIFFSRCAGICAWLWIRYNTIDTINLKKSTLFFVYFDKHTATDVQYGIHTHSIYNSYTRSILSKLRLLMFRIIQSLIACSCYIFSYFFLKYLWLEYFIICLIKHRRNLPCRLAQRANNRNTGYK